MATGQGFMCCQVVPRVYGAEFIFLAHCYIILFWRKFSCFQLAMVQIFRMLCISLFNKWKRLQTLWEISLFWEDEPSSTVRGEFCEEMPSISDHPLGGPSLSSVSRSSQIQPWTRQFWKCTNRVYSIFLTPNRSDRRCCLLPP